MLPAGFTFSGANLNRPTRRALEDWQGFENLEGRIRKGEEIDALVLAHLRRVAAERAGEAR